MKRLTVNPNTSPRMTQEIDHGARPWARPETEIVTVHPTRGPRSIAG